MFDNRQIVKQFLGVPTDYSGRHGGRRVQLAPRPGCLQARAARRCVRHGPRPGVCAPSCRWRPGRPYAPRAGRISVSGDGAPALAGLLRSPAESPPERPIQPPPCISAASPRKLIELCIVANFVEVFLAREGHTNPVGVNFLEKVQLPHLASIYGAMLAGVGYVLMGAGIPLHIPGVLDAFAAGRPAEYRLAVTGAVEGQGEDAMMRFDPGRFCGGPPSQPRPSHGSWPSSPPTPWPQPCCGAPAGGWTVL